MNERLLEFIDIKSKELDVTKQEIFRRANIHYNSLYTWKKGRTPQYETVEALGRVLGDVDLTLCLAGYLPKDISPNLVAKYCPQLRKITNDQKS